MHILDEFFESEEFQKKYGFECFSDKYGNNHIVYQGDLGELMKTAYEVLGFVEVKGENETGDLRPELNIQFNQDGMLIIKDTGVFIETDVDGVGSEPNFYIRFAGKDDTITIRFNLLKPELYPDNLSTNYRLSNSSLSTITDFLRRNHPRLIKKWNHLRKDAAFEIEMIPNYRAINRVM